MYYDRSRKELLVADSDNHRIIKFSLDNLSADGIVVAGDYNNGGCNLNQLGRPEGLALDSRRQLYVADTSCHRVTKFPADSNSTVYGEFITYMYQPQAIYIDHRMDDVYIGDSNDGIIMKFINGSTVGTVFAGIENGF